jgi:hypothetical protein
LQDVAGNGHEGDAKTPSGSSVQKGSDYHGGYYVFKEQGFRTLKQKSWKI